MLKIRSVPCIFIRTKLKLLYNETTMRRLIRFSLSGFIALAGFLPVRAQENWSGYEGGNLHQNASAVEVNPSQLSLARTTVFSQPISGANYAFGSRNMVTNGSYVAIVAKANGITAANGMEYVTILDANGNVVNVITVDLKKGPGYNEYAPDGIYIDSHDVGPGLQTLAWDPTNDILYIKSGGDNGKSVAYKPLANLASFSGSAQTGVNAFGSTAEWVPSSTARRNESSFFEVDPATDAIWSSDGYHFVSVRSRSYVFSNKNTGQKATGTVPAAFEGGFAYWGGTMAGNGRLFVMGRDRIMISPEVLEIRGFPLLPGALTA